MKPGRELDALVAEKVMGWNRDHEKRKLSYYYGDDLYAQDLITKLTDVEIPSYSTDIAAAWEVVERFQEEHGLLMFLRANPNGTYEISLECNGVCRDDWKDAACEFYGSSSGLDSAPHAICLAALKAVGAKI